MALGNPELVITTEDVFISSPWVKQILNKKNVGFSGFDSRDEWNQTNHGLPNANSGTE